MSIKTLKDLYIATLRDMYDGESQLMDALAEMSESASNSDLQSAYSDHREETSQHKERLKQILEGLGENTSGGQCDGLTSLIEQGQALIKEQAEGPVRDAGLIATAQQVEHFEIAVYGTLCSHAESLERNDDLALLKDTLTDEKAADCKLKDIALSAVNPKAAA